MLQHVGDILLVLSAIPAVASVAVFSRVQWWKTPLGRHMMGYMVVMAAVLVLGCIRLVIGRVPAFDVARVTVFCGVPAVMWWRLFVLLAAQRDGDHFNEMGAHGTPGVPAPRSPSE